MGLSTDALMAKAGDVHVGVSAVNGWEDMDMLDGSKESRGLHEVSG